MLGGKPHILLDLSRLLWRAGRAAPTGIERVEMAYAKYLLNSAAERTTFVAITRWGTFRLIPPENAADLIDAVQREWRHGRSGWNSTARNLSFLLHLKMAISGERAIYEHVKSITAPLIYLLVSHHHLERPRAIDRLLRRTGARFVGMVHDTIPYAYPEYARPGHDDLHAVRMNTLARYADALIFNSNETERLYSPFMEQTRRDTSSLVVPLGVDQYMSSYIRNDPTTIRPYFVCVSTIEPRKNHMLLLHIWRRMAQTENERAPRLILIGHRGWENENTLDLLERCGTLRGLVEERGAVSDEELGQLVRGARAVLLPSFVEGFGLPVAEALAMGVPVLCSDLPALRDAGGNAAEYLDPLDGPAWHSAILDYATHNSPRRAAQQLRMQRWKMPQWRDHFAMLENLLDDVINKQPQDQRYKSDQRDTEVATSSAVNAA